MSDMERLIPTHPMLYTSALHVRSDASLQKWLRTERFGPLVCRWAPELPGSQGAVQPAPEPCSPEQTGQRP